MALTIGKAAKYLTSADLNLSLFMCMIVLSTTVAFCIIQISLTERPISEAATNNNKPLSTLQKRGTSMAGIKKESLFNGIIAP